MEEIFAHKYVCNVSKFEEDITNLYYQLERKQKGESLSDVVCTYKWLVRSAIETRNTFHMNILITILLQTRDIVKGKGEYTLFYNLLTTFDQYWNVVEDKLTRGLSLVFDARITNVVYDQQFNSSYGSWKDVKYILNHYKEFYAYSKTDFIKFIETPGIVNTIIKFVKHSYVSDDTTSLLTRWLPRESSIKFGWQASIFAAALFPSATIRVSLINYRKYCATGNRLLNTTQVFQCSKNWKDINFVTDVTRATMARQKRAFLCNHERYTIDSDRISCRDNFIKYKQYNCHYKSPESSSKINLRDVLKSIYNKSSNYYDNSLVEFMWRQAIDEVRGVFKYSVVLLDNSCLIKCLRYDAIWLTLLMSSGDALLGNQIIESGTMPRWHSMKDCESFQDLVVNIIKIGREEDINIYAAFKMIADECLCKDIDPESVGKLVLTIITTKDIDNNFLHNYTLQESLTRLFQETGMKSTHKRPYKRPTLVFWNMNRPHGFPSATSTNNTILMSGYNDDILTDVINKGICSLKEITPWTTLSDILMKERYTWFW